MPTLVKNLSDSSVIYKNTLTEQDMNCADIKETSFKLSFAEGEMNMRGWHFEGIRIGYSDIVLNTLIATEWKNDLDMVHLHFNLGGKTYIEQKGRDTLILDRLQHNLSYQNGFDGVVRYDELHSKIFVVQFTKEAFLKQVANSSGKLINFGKKITMGKPVVFSAQSCFIDANIHAAINAILNCRYEGGIKKMFFLSKCIELLALQAEAFEKAEQKKFTYCKTGYDRERILFAHDYLLQHYDVPPTLAELARAAGINEFKLKNGFKEIFNNTVFGYLTDYKMELAKNELQQGVRTASQLAYDLGYSSLQHFSRVYKKKFGVSPKNH